MILYINIYLLGVGFSFLEVSTCIVQLFFVRRQAFSVAVCKAGYSAGVLFWSNFVQFAIAKYGYRGALVVMAGINLHGYVIAAIIRGPNFKIKKESCREVPSNTHSNGSYLVRSPDDNSSIEMENVERSQVLKIKIDRNIDAEKHCPAIAEVGKHTSNESDDSVSVSKHISLQRNGTLGDVVCRTSGSKTVDGDNMEKSGIGKTKPHLSLTRNGCHINKNVDRNMVNNEMHRFQGYCKKFGNILGVIIDISLLKIPTFSLFCLAIFLGSVGEILPFYFIPMRVAALGIPKHSTAMLIMYLGIGGAIGRILIGWVADQLWADRKLMYSCSLTVAGCISCIAYFVSDYSALIAYCALFAIASGRPPNLSLFCCDALLWEKKTWWRHQMETFSALLAICVGNSPVPGEFPTQRPVTLSFVKQWWGWWFETPSCPLWRNFSAIRWSCRMILILVEDKNPLKLHYP